VPSDRPPRLHRLARSIRLVGLVVLILVVVFVVTAAYSASRLRVERSNAAGPTAEFAGTDRIVVVSAVNLSNPGLYPIDQLTIVSRIAWPDGTLLASSESTPQSIAGMSSVTVPVRLDLNPGATGSLYALLTKDEVLPVTTWANATYAGAFPVSVAVRTNYSWGAPFAGLAATAGTPVDANGSFQEPVTVTFANDAPLADQGTFAFSLIGAQGQVCGSGTLGVDVPPGSSFGQSLRIPIATGCPLAGGSVMANYQSASWNLALPPEAIP
jgi:hypothetical protein